MKNPVTNALKLAAALAAVSLTAGCIGYGSKNIAHFTYTVVGVRVGQAPTGAYEMNVGLTRASGDIVPVGKDGRAPAVTSKMELDAKMTQTKIKDDYSTGGATREFTTGARGETAGGETPATSTTNPK